MLRIARCWVALSIAAASFAQQPQGDPLVTSWAASVQGPYPVGNPSAQPNLSLAFPSAKRGARPVVPPDRQAGVSGGHGADAFFQCARRAAGQRSTVHSSACSGRARGDARTTARITSRQGEA